MKSKTILNDFLNLIPIIALMVYFTGFKNTLNIFYELLKSINLVMTQLCNESILTFVFKYLITFPIVGLLLAWIGSPRGRAGHYIGKVFYFVVGYVVAFALDLIAKFVL